MLKKDTRADEMACIDKQYARHQRYCVHLLMRTGLRPIAVDGRTASSPKYVATLLNSLFSIQCNGGAALEIDMLSSSVPCDCGFVVLRLANRFSVLSSHLRNPSNYAAMQVTFSADNRDGIMDASLADAVVIILSMWAALAETGDAKPIVLRKRINDIEAALIFLREAEFCRSWQTANPSMPGTAR